MTRLATTPAIFGILVSGMGAGGLLAGCGSNKVEIGVQNADAQPTGLDAAAGRGGAAGRGSDAAAAGSGGVTATGGTTPTGGTTGGGGVTATGGTTPGGGTTGGGGVSATGGSTPSGGTTGAGGTTGGGGAIRTGGTTGTGGTTPAGGTTEAGGATSTGGATAAGGTTRTGGTTGTGGTGGAIGATCGGLRGMACSPGQFCDLPAGSCNVSDATGTCVANAGLGCIAIYQPVCGCDGKTYSSDCVRQSAGASKKADGACPTADAAVATCSQVTTQAECDGRSDCHSVFLPGTACACAAVGCCQLFNRCADGGRANCSGPAVCMAPQPSCPAPYALSYTNNCYEGCVRETECAGTDGGAKDAPADAATTQYPTAWLAWQAPGGIAGVGAAVVVSGAGGAEVWTRVNGFPPETPPSEIPTMYSLTTAEVDDLFGRLASMDFSQLPHPGTGFECYPTLYFRLCKGCSATTLNYDVPSEILPEMEPVWAWFDQLLGATDYTNPRNYCQLPAATLCTATGGQVSSALCCNSATDFPNSCSTGACGCAPASSHTVSTCNCSVGCFMPAYGCVSPAGTCTVGADQTCNDNLAISSLHGRCVDSGRCLCDRGWPLVVSGKCQ